MSTEQELRTYFQRQFESFTHELNGSQMPEISKLRQEAMTSFEQQGFPLLKNEEYKYTPVTKELLRSLDTGTAIRTEAKMVPAFNQYLIPDLLGHILVFWNGRLVFRTSELPKGLSISDIGSHQQKLPAVSEHLATVTDLQKDAFTALNTAFFNHGACIHVAADTIIHEPVILYHLWDHEAKYLQTRNLTVVEKHSKCNLIEIYRNTDSSKNCFHNTVTEIKVAEGAHFSYQKIQTDCGEAIHVGNTHLMQEDHSVIDCTTISSDGRMIRNNLNVTVNGSGCESHMYGLYLLKGKNHVDNHTMVDHRLPSSFSNELYKGIIDDSATGVFNGKIYVRTDAQKTNAFQSNKNILLSDRASMNTKPQLEIWADDVKCSHGATTGQLDKDQMFYLRARGLDEQQARGLLLYAFAHETLEHVPSDVLKLFLEQVIVERLYKKDHE